MRESLGGGNPRERSEGEGGTWGPPRREPPRPVSAAAVSPEAACPRGSGVGGASSTDPTPLRGGIRVRALLLRPERW